MNTFLKISLLISAITMSGCASIISGSTQTLSFKSIPELSQISITNRNGETVHVGQTPTTVTLKKGAGYFKAESYKVVFSKDGYESKTVEIKAKVGGWYFGNILLGGIIGLLIVDPVTGAMYTLTPEDVSAVLESKGVTAADKTLTVILQKDISNDFMARAIQLN